MNLKVPASLVLLTFVIAAGGRVQAQQYHVLYRFQGPTEQPNAPLIGGKVKGSLHLYGTTPAGISPHGTVFSFIVGTGESVVHRFGGIDGSAPTGGLALDSQDNGYGLTSFGGGTGCGGRGCGVVYRIDNPSGAFSVVYSFAGPPNDGYGPNGTLLWDPLRGNFYGVTGAGGNNDGGVGTVFSITPSGTETVLYNFCSLPNCADGENPISGLVEDAQGNLYGVTAHGGNPACEVTGASCGTIFKLDTAGNETVLHSFANGADGGYPQGGLVSDGQGNLYGTTFEGGNSACNQNGCGTVFKVDASGNFSVIHAFGGPDGAYPENGSLAWSAETGLLYGGAEGGGGNNLGVIFQMDTSGNETVLHNFEGETQGAEPNLGVLLGSGGNIYGTTLSGGYEQNGVIFEAHAVGATPSGATTGYVTVTTPTGVLTSNVPFRVIP
jgi:uncharacterized repeat protein (TIGR03803 family)